MIFKVTIKSINNNTYKYKITYKNIKHKNKSITGITNTFIWMYSDLISLYEKIWTVPLYPEDNLIGRAGIAVEMYDRSSHDFTFPYYLVVSSRDIERAYRSLKLKEIIGIK